ncbi:amidoligase family protein [Paenibacillus melissococcoides]|uniref:Amidoligase family protein n=1 Tax=Paenibacillus melissococcoides TaxID=2912268 RepID=A0ABN8UFZ8_9BACL|nr:amidoligase family protein [Paenibacillus melissococcoides]CAH8248473.1 amidoligase family protein [Paenibacillus melissococcoides]CAH8722110.1 amidoligase family protein [Paenibacillus melissococcoides]CAH8722135.1 amidoligase family protein [Paenibacillus melissococcoides]
MQAVQQVREMQSAVTPSSPEEIAITSLRAEIDRLQPITPDILREAERGFSEINWIDDEIRENVLDVWRENRAFDGIYMSEDDAAWDQLRADAEADWIYKYENVLGGTGNTFGVELEVELERFSASSEILEALRREGITDQTQVNYYHGTRSRPGMWCIERDGSLDNGIEIVSPILMDRREDWEKLQRVTEILKEHGAFVNSNCGGHIHIGIGPLDHRTYSWQRLARIGLGYERLFYRMGGADSEAYRINGFRGQHRGDNYAAPFSSEARNIVGTDTAVRARRQISSSRYRMFNTTNIDASLRPKPTVEMRYPNGSLDCKQWQTQIQVANAVVHQSGVIRNDSPQSAFTPGLYQTSSQLRRSDMCNEATETMYFRRFLDVLGNRDDRLAATWLFLRGQA